MRQLILLIIYNVRYIKHLMRAPTFKTNECHYVLYIALFYSTKSRATLLNHIGVYIYLLHTTVQLILTINEDYDIMITI